MSPEDHARDLIASTPDAWISAGEREGLPLGLTYAVLIPADNDDFDQLAWERANGKVMESLLEGAGDDPEWASLDGMLVVRVLDDRGRVTAEGRAAAEAMCALADYPILDDEVHSEIQMLGFDYEWENDVKADIENGYFDVWDGGRIQLEIIDDLPAGWEDKVAGQYSSREHESQEDDRGYHSVDRKLVAEILNELDYVVEEDDDE